MEFKIEKQKDRKNEKKEIDILMIRTNHSEDWEIITWKDLCDLVSLSLGVETRNNKEGKLYEIEGLIDLIISYFFCFDKNIPRRIELTHKKLIRKVMRYDFDNFNLEHKLRLLHFFKQQTEYWEKHLPTEENKDRLFKEQIEYWKNREKLELEIDEGEEEMINKLEKNAK